MTRQELAKVTKMKARTERYCRKQSPRKLVCTLANGHAGHIHVAHGMDGRVLDSWEETNR